MSAAIRGRADGKYGRAASPLIVFLENRNRSDDRAPPSDHSTASFDDRCGPSGDGARPTAHRAARSDDTIACSDAANLRSVTAYSRSDRPVNRTASTHRRFKSAYACTDDCPARTADDDPRIDDHDARTDHCPLHEDNDAHSFAECATAIDHRAELDTTKTIALLSGSSRNDRNFSDMSQLDLVCWSSPTDPRDKPDIVQIHPGES
ncbi:MAG: hypothetical protein ACJ796_16880 [Gemmatimonadaceae bacterium]